jgi:hypothetical protein
LTNSKAGAASTSAETLTGAPYTAGTATTNYPLEYLNDGTAPTTWSTAGTEFGVNAPSGFTGNFFDFHVNGGASVASLSYTGALTVASCTGCGSSTTFQANGSNLTSASTVNFEGAGSIVVTNPSAGNVQISASQAINPQTGTTYAMLTGDAGKLVTFANASAVAVSLSQATTAGFTSGYSFDVQNKGAGTVTITPATSTINGSSTLTIPQNDGCTITSDGANYQVSACTALVAGGSSAFSSLTGGTNTAAAMLVGSGASLGPTGTGTITATGLNTTIKALTSGSSPYTLLAADAGKLLTFSWAFNNFAITLPQAGTTGFAAGQSFTVQGLANTTLVITPTTSTINGLSSFQIQPGGGCTMVSDGTNYQVGPCTGSLGLLAFDSPIALPNIGYSGALWVSATPPTVTSGLGTSPVVTGNSTGAFQIAAGSTGTPSTTVVLAMSTATHGWSCQVTDQSTLADTAHQSANTTTSVTFTFNTAPSVNDKLVFLCGAF